MQYIMQAVHGIFTLPPFLRLRILLLVTSMRKTNLEYLAVEQRSVCPLVIRFLIQKELPL